MPTIVAVQTGSHYVVTPIAAAICARLRGDVSVLAASRANLLLPVDLVHPPTGTVIEVDGPEHFTSPRLAAHSAPGVLRLPCGSAGSHSNTSSMRCPAGT